MHTLPKEDQYAIHMHHRYVKLLKTICMPEIELRMATCLLLSPRPISRSSLAVAMQENRTTILPYVKEAHVMGFLEYVEGDCPGVTLTKRGRFLLRRLVSESLNICRGDRVGFSPYVIKALRQGQAHSPKKKNHLPSKKTLQELRFEPPLQRPVRN